MRPFQVNQNQWINLEHVADWEVADGRVRLTLTNYRPEGFEWSHGIEGEYAERFIKAMEWLASRDETQWAVNPNT